MALSCKVPAALPLRVLPSFFNPSFLLGYLLFLIYLGPYHWWWEALWNCVFSVFICHVCSLIFVKKHLHGYAKQGTKQRRWMGRTLRPASQIIITPQLNCGWKARWTSLNKRWGDQRVDWKLLAAFSWVASGRVVSLGFCLTHISKCLTEWRD